MFKLNTFYFLFSFEKTHRKEKTFAIKYKQKFHKKNHYKWSKKGMIKWYISKFYGSTCIITNLKFQMRICKVKRIELQ